MSFNWALNVCACAINTWTTYRYIHTYIHKYSDFLVALISVGLAHARPNKVSVNVVILGRCKHQVGEPSLRCSLTSMYALYIIVKPDSNDWMKSSKEYQNLNDMKREAA